MYVNVIYIMLLQLLKIIFLHLNIYFNNVKNIFSTFAFFFQNQSIPIS